MELGCEVEFLESQLVIAYSGAKDGRSMHSFYVLHGQTLSSIPTSDKSVWSTDSLTRFSRSAPLLVSVLSAMLSMSTSLLGTPQIRFLESLSLVCISGGTKEGVEPAWPGHGSCPGSRTVSRAHHYQHLT